MVRQPLVTAALECWVIGHRGAAALWPENTISAFCAARDTGAVMIECDVQQSTDGALFVFHDQTLERLCGESIVASSLTWEVLAQKSIGQIPDRVVPIPLLDEVFTTLQRSVLYNVELKTEEGRFPGIEEKLVALLAKHDLTERTLLSSFYHQSLRLARRWSPTLALGLLLSQEQARQFATAQDIVSYSEEYGCVALHPDFRVLRQCPDLVPACHAANLRVFPWTIDDPRDWRFLVEELHVDGIITNNPAALYAWLRARVCNSSTGQL